MGSKKMKFIKERIATLEAMEAQIDRRIRALKSYSEGVQKGEKDNFKGELFIWDQGGSNKICIATQALFSDQEIATAIEQSMERLKEKSLEIRPVLEMAERALKN